MPTGELTPTPRADYLQLGTMKALLLAMVGSCSFSLFCVPAISPNASFATFWKPCRLLTYSSIPVLDSRRLVPFNRAGATGAPRPFHATFCGHARQCRLLSFLHHEVTESSQFACRTFCGVGNHAYRPSSNKSEAKPFTDEDQLVRDRSLLGTHKTFLQAGNRR